MKYEAGFLHQCFKRFKKFTSTECVLRYIITIMASPTLTSAAATTMIKKTNNCPSMPVPTGTPPGTAAGCGIFENATSNRFTAFSISSMHIKTMIALRRVNTPTTPIQNRAMERNM